MKGIIDRFEGEFVVVEIDGKTIDFPISIFPNDTNVGDVVLIEGKNVSILQNETKKRRKEIDELMKDVWEG